MKVLITGGSGFIGSHLTKFHLKKNDVVTVIDNYVTLTGTADNTDAVTGLRTELYKSNTGTLGVAAAGNIFQTIYFFL